MPAIRLVTLAFFVASLVLAGCSTFGGSSSPASENGSNSSIFKNPLVYQGTTVPPPITEQKIIDCPQSVIRDGGAVMRNGKGQAVSSQMTIRTVVRECAEDGESLIVKVGVEGVAVIGIAGKPGPVSAPLTITVDRDGKTLSTRATSAKATIGPDGHALFSLVEEGIKIPPGDGETIINVGFKN